MGLAKFMRGEGRDFWMCPHMTDAVEKGLRTSPNSDSADCVDGGLGGGDDGSAERRSTKFYLSVSAR